MAKPTATATKRAGRGSKKPVPFDFDFGIFSKYAELLDKDLKKKCETEKQIFFSYTENTITILDQFPKAIFHLLVLPRVKAPPRTTTNLKSLRYLFSSNFPKSEAKKVIQEIAEDAKAVVKEIEADMLSAYRFVWPIHVGFHIVQSMDHIHLHIISSDFQGSGMKKKKHYNSFNPNGGYFLHLKDVLAFFEATDSFYDSAIRPIKYEQHRLREQLDAPIECHHCNKNFGNQFAESKRHLEEVWAQFMAIEQTKADVKEQNRERQARWEAAKAARRAAEGGDSPKEVGSAEVPIEIEE